MPKHKRVKYKKAPGAPRRFKSAYMFYSTDKHKEIRKELDKDGKKEKVGRFRWIAARDCVSG